MIVARAERLVSADGTQNRFTGYPAGKQQLSKLSALSFYWERSTGYGICRSI